MPRPIQVPWGGHNPATRLALEEILKSSITGKGRVRSHEQALIRACELRRAVANREWLERLTRNSFKELGYARLITAGPIVDASIARYAQSLLDGSCGIRGSLDGNRRP